MSGKHDLDNRGDHGDGCRLLDVVSLDAVAKDNE